MQTRMSDIGKATDLEVVWDNSTFIKERLSFSDHDNGKNDEVMTMMMNADQLHWAH